MSVDYEGLIGQELTKELKERVSYHKKRFIYMFKARYKELLPSLIQYQNGNQVSVDWLKVEVALRSGYDVVIGETMDTSRRIQVIGWAKNKKSSENPSDLFSQDGLRHGDIQFLIPEHIRFKYYKEISYQDGCQTGNFVVLRNKTLQFINDYLIVDHYTDELAEIVLSRYSITMQVKIMTIFLSEPNDETINEFVNDLYNGSPYSKATKNFDPVDQIYHMKNEGLASNFQELKREYQNKISELNNMLGINSLAVEKASGVSDEEAKSNRGFTTSNANIYLDGRNHGLKKLNKRYGLELEALYNDEVLSEFAQHHKEMDKEEGDQPNENTV